MLICLESLICEKEVFKCLKSKTCKYFKFILVKQVKCVILYLSLFKFKLFDMKIECREDIRLTNHHTF